mgnify:CR=1 FL=1
MNKHCNDCPRAATGCLRYISELSPEDIRDWCARRKTALALTNQNIADAANISRRTVERFFSSNIQDFRFSSVQPILLVLLEDFDCRTHSAQTAFEAERADMKIQSLEQQLKTEKRDVVFARKYVVVLSIALAIAVAIIVAALIIDLLHADRGFFWLEKE